MIEGDPGAVVVSMPICTAGEPMETTLAPVPTAMLVDRAAAREAPPDNRRSSAGNCALAPIANTRLIMKSTFWRRNASASSTPPATMRTVESRAAQRAAALPRRLPGAVVPHADPEIVRERRGARQGQAADDGDDGGERDHAELTAGQRHHQRQRRRIAGGIESPHRVTAGDRGSAEPTIMPARK